MSTHFKIQPYNTLYMEQQSYILSTILIIPDELIDVIMSFMKSKHQLPLVMSCKRRYLPYQRTIRETANILFHFQSYAAPLLPLFCCDEKLQTVQFSFYTGGYTKILQRHMSQNRWLHVNELELISLNSQKTDPYPEKVLRLNQDLNVPSGLDYESVVALILAFSRHPNYRPMPNISFFRRFPNLRFLVLQYIGLDKNTASTLCEITSLRFVYMHYCSAREFGFGPFENFEICENIQNLYLNSCSFNDNSLSFSSKLRRLKIVKCYKLSEISTFKCSYLKSLQIQGTMFNPQNLTLPEHPCLTSLNLGFISNHPELLKVFDHWLLGSPITSLKKLVVYWDFCPRLDDHPYAMCPKYVNVHLNFSGFKNLKKLVIGDFDPRNTLSCTFSRGIEPIIVKSIWEGLEYFNGPIRAEKFRIYPPSTEMFIPLSVPSFLLTIPDICMELIFEFLLRKWKSSILALKVTCKMIYEYQPKYILVSRYDPLYLRKKH